MSAAAAFGASAKTIFEVRSATWRCLTCSLSLAQKRVAAGFEPTQPQQEGCVFRRWYFQGLQSDHQWPPRSKWLFFFWMSGEGCVHGQFYVEMSTNIVICDQF